MIDNATPAEIYENEKFSDKLLRTAIDVAENLIKCGGTVHNAEDTVERICKAHGAIHVEVFSITSVIIASVRMKDGEYAMQTRRIYGFNNNFTKLDKLNSISRDLCDKKITLDEAQAKIREAKAENTYPPMIKVLVSMIISGSFALFFGGTLLDAAASAVLGAFITVLSSFVPKTLNKLATNLLLSTITGFMAIFCSKLGFGDNYDKIIIGTIMLVIPGLSFGTSIRDLLGGDTLSGMLQLIQSILLAATIAFGYTIAIFFLDSWIV